MRDDATFAWVAEWLRFSSEDLDAARTIGAAPWIRTYHAQQAAEKAIKAVLIFVSIDPPKVHDLTLLHELFDDPSWLDVSVDELNRLTRWGIPQRYPSEAPDPTTADAERAIEIATRVVDAAHQLVTLQDRGKP